MSGWLIELLEMRNQREETTYSANSSEALENSQVDFESITEISSRGVF